MPDYLVSSVLAVGYVAILSFSYFVRKFDQDAITYLAPFQKIDRFLHRLIMMENQLPVPVFRFGYFSGLIFLLIVKISNLMLALFEIDAFVYVMTALYILCITLAFASFNLRIANRTKKLYPHTALCGRIFKSIIPGIIVGLGLGVIYAVFRKSDSIMVYWFVLSGCVASMLLLHVNFSSLGAIILFSLVNYGWDVFDFNFYIADPQSGFKKSVYYRSENLDHVISDTEFRIKIDSIYGDQVMRNKSSHDVNYNAFNFQIKGAVFFTLEEYEHI